jgi:hypothetical protein
MAGCRGVVTRRSFRLCTIDAGGAIMTCACGLLLPSLLLLHLGLLLRRSLPM